MKIEKIKTLVATDTLNQNLLVEHTRKINELIDAWNNQQKEYNQCKACDWKKLSGSEPTVEHTCKEKKCACLDIGTVHHCKNQPSKPSVREAIYEIILGRAFLPGEKTDQILDLVRKTILEKAKVKEKEYDVVYFSDKGACISIKDLEEILKNI